MSLCMGVNLNRWRYIKLVNDFAIGTEINILLFCKNGIDENNSITNQSAMNV